MQQRRRQRGRRLLQTVFVVSSVVSSVTSFTTPPAITTLAIDAERRYVNLPRGWFPHLHLSASNSEDMQQLKAEDLPPLYNESKIKHLPSILPNGGQITLLGSGPGDPDLLTVAAYNLLTNNNQDDQKKKTLVISDRLVSQEILDLIPQNMEIKIANKHPGCQAQAQEEIYHWCYNGLKEGKHVIRLKIGDPFVFGRGGEEVLMFRKYGVQPKVIPGVSAAFSAPLLGSIPVTHRGVSNQVVMCTGYGKENTSPDLIQYHPEQTVVFLMAVGRLRTLCDRLQTLANYPSTTPVAIVENAGRPFQRTIVGTIETIADVAEDAKVVPPSTIVVGDVVRVLLDDEDENGVVVEMIKEAEETQEKTKAAAPIVEVISKKRKQETAPTIVTLAGMGKDSTPRNETVTV